MAWQTPKTDWTPPDGVTDADLNRIEGNIQELQNTKETPSGAQAKVDAHEAKAAPHSGHATTTALTTHTGNNVVHITSSERTTWNNKQDALSAERIRKITFGTAVPTGGSDGDIYFQYE